MLAESTALSPAKPKPAERPISVGILLSGREKFGPYYGGALARWTYEVYSRLPGEVRATVFGFPTDPSDLYSLPHQTSRVSQVCKLVGRVPGLRRHEDWLWLGALMPKLRDYDVLHVHNRPQWVRLLRRLGYRGRILLHLQNNHLGHWNGASLDQLAPHVDTVVVCSNYLRDTFAPNSIALASKTRVTFNGVNTRMFFPREELRQPKMILFTGRFSEDKGVRELVKAFSLVLKTHPDAKLIIAGTPLFGIDSETPYVREVLGLAHSTGRGTQGRIEFAGYVHHDKELPSCFQRASIFTSPSIFQEPFGLVNAEAMACATPVVGSNRGGIPEVLGDTGLLVNPEDIEAYAAALCRMLAKPDYRAQLGKAAYERCLRMFDWRVIAAEWTGVLQGLVAGART